MVVTHIKDADILFSLFNLRTWPETLPVQSPTRPRLSWLVKANKWPNKWGRSILQPSLCWPTIKGSKTFLFHQVTAAVQFCICCFLIYCVTLFKAFFFHPYRRAKQNSTNTIKHNTVSANLNAALRAILHITCQMGSTWLIQISHSYLAYKFCTVDMILNKVYFKMDFGVCVSLDCKIIMWFVYVSAPCF